MQFLADLSRHRVQSRRTTIVTGDRKLKKYIWLSLITAAAASPLALADSNSIVASIRIGASFVDNEAVNSDFSLRNFGSRILWSGEKDLDIGLTGIALLEFGFNPDSGNAGISGIDQTRKAWVGLKNELHSMKIGTQYSSFYDMVSGHTDIAWWGSCWTQFECGRETNVLKYTGKTDNLVFSASLQAFPEDEGNDIADQFELGVNYTINNILFGIAASVHADNGVDNGGNLIGGVIALKTETAGLGLGVQFADEDFADLEDDFANVTVTASFGNSYALFNRGYGDRNNPQYLTVGYTLNLDPSALMYFEYQFVDDDTPADEENLLRAVLKYDFGVI